MKYHAIFFTDMSDKIWHARPIGAYRLASELRSHGYNVLVIDFLGQWLSDLREFDVLLKTIISDQTRFIGYSSTFFSTNTNERNLIDSFQKFYGHSNHYWPTAYTKIVRMINQRIKKLNPKIKIFYGGSKANIITQELIDGEVDYIVQGFADSIIVEIMDNLCNDRHIRYTPKNNCRVIDYDHLGQKFNFVDSQTIYHESDCFLDNEVLPIETSRGCLFKCKFCSYPLLGRKKNDPAYHKCVSAMTEEFRRNHEQFGITRYMFVDDTFNESTQKLQQIHDSIRTSGVDIRFSCYLRLDLIEKYPEQIEILKDMGLQSCFLGIETLNLKTARAIGKHSRPEWVKETLVKMKNVLGDRCTIFGSFIAGLPYDNEQTINEWMSWVYDHPDLIHGFAINVLNLRLNSKFPSDLDRDPASYGYQIDEQANWVNNMGLTSAQAREICQHWMDLSWKNSRIRVSGWETMGMQNLGYQFEDLRKMTLDRLPMEDIHQRYQDRFQNYKNKLFRYLNLQIKNKS